MSSSVRVLDFFVVEATEYIDQMDAMLNAARPGAGAPNVDALMAAAHRLRGSATMARQTAIAAVGAGVERVARALREKRVPWDASTAAALVAAVDDLRLLVRGARSWSSLEEQRARARGEELARLAPPGATPRSGARAVGSRSGFLAGETLELSRALDAVGPGANPAVIGSATERVRALRGVADVRDMPPLPDVMEALEATLKSMELAGAAHPCGPKEAALFSSAAAVLRRVSRDLAASGRPAPDMSEMVAFEAALGAVSDETGRADRIVPIAELFAGDGSSGVVSAATHPPTTPAERFRLEVVSLAEHLRGVVAEARAQRGGEHRDRSSRDVRNAVRALGATANSFGEKVVARFAAEWSTRASALEESALAALDAAAALFTNPDTSAADIARGLERLGSGATTARATPMASAAQSAPARTAAPQAPAP
ncbi:MAG TPA: Hpt domain-containing protein, partial [Gemmatimonadaceae bacterium]|nr:Hpt domain-containing protein [Gemmatimonadaceae bacterium]